MPAGVLAVERASCPRDIPADMGMNTCCTHYMHARLRDEAHHKVWMKACQCSVEEAFRGACTTREPGTLYPRSGLWARQFCPRRGRRSA